MDRVKVRIANRDFTLKTDEKPEYIKHLARIVDSRMNELINGSGGGISAIDAAVLTAMTAIDEFTKINENIDNIRTQIKGYVDDATSSRQKLEEAEREIRALKEKLSKGNRG